MFGVSCCVVGLVMLAGWDIEKLSAGEGAPDSEITLWNTEGFFGHMGLAIFAFEG